MCFNNFLKFTFIKDNRTNNKKKFLIIHQKLAVNICIFFFDMEE